MKKGIYAFSLLVFLSGCSNLRYYFLNYNSRIKPVKQEVSTKDYKKALLEFKKTNLNKDKKNRLLYHLEAGLLYHMAGDYDRSNYFLERAEWISDELYTKSLSNEAASLVTSDKVIPYRGEYYEYLFTNYYKLLNYLHLGNLEDALVEVRRINHKLSLFDQDDAFMHYLTSMLYQYNNQSSDAFIEYKKAYQGYTKKYDKKYNITTPSQIKKDIAVFCRETGFSRCNEFPKRILNSYRPPDKYGSVVFLVETNFIPHLTDKKIEAAIPQKYKRKHKNKLADVYYLTIEMPVYKPRKNWVEEVSLNLAGKSVKMDLVEDLGEIARANLESEESKILAKSMARAVAKYLTYKSVDGGKEEKGLLQRVLKGTVNVLGTATEQADTRSWLTLPDRIFLSRQYLEPGKYSFNLRIKSSKGSDTLTEKEEFTIEQGEIKFIVLRRFIDL
ncbi:MAG: COG3014 family protein [Elusimicrobiota bacterium]